MLNIHICNKYSCMLKMSFSTRVLATILFPDMLGRPWPCNVLMSVASSDARLKDNRYPIVLQYSDCVVNACAFRNKR